ncbi:hypothetical protein PR048_011779 [Dryococelus australis]|uniref:Uncharacterized protein n=1 Tax=Dryococelus australis TaxID=614101 RepID=A0ABQ9HMK6_9NEOP|nr:hypothetical protein PR048_011779 [Dryococelus australis]
MGVATYITTLETRNDPVPQIADERSRAGHAVLRIDPALQGVVLLLGTRVTFQRSHRLFFPLLVIILKSVCCSSPKPIYRVATVAVLLARSPPTKANRVQYSTGSPVFRKWESCRAMPLVSGFSRGSPVPPPPSFRRRSIFTSITPIVSQYLAVKRRPNLFIHLFIGYVLQNRNKLALHLDKLRYMTEYLPNIHEINFCGSSYRFVASCRSFERHRTTLLAPVDIRRHAHTSRITLESAVNHEGEPWDCPTCTEDPNYHVCRHSASSDAHSAASCESQYRWQMAARHSTTSLNKNDKVIGTQCFRGRIGVVVRLLASHLGEPDSIPGGGGSRIFACGNRTGQCHWSVGFPGDLAFPLPWHSGVAPCRAISGAQDLDVKRHLNLSILTPPLLDLT